MEVSLRHAAPAHPRRTPDHSARSEGEAEDTARSERLQSPHDHVCGAEFAAHWGMSGLDDWLAWEGGEGGQKWWDLVEIVGKVDHGKWVSLDVSSV